MMNQPVEISPATAFELTGQGVMLVDIREPEEIREAAFDVRNLIFIPYSQLEEHYHEIPSDRQVIIACQVGERSLMATCFLMARGYEKAVNLQDGIVSWVEKGFPVKGTLKRRTGGCCCGSGKGSANNSTG